MTFVLSPISTGIVIPALPRPSLEYLQSGDRDKRPWLSHVYADTTTESEIILHLARVVGPDEESIDATTYLQRVAGSRNLGYQHACWLRDNLNYLNEEQRTLLLKILGGNALDFPGLVVIRDDSSMGIPQLCQGRGNDVHFAGLDYVFHRRVAFGIPT